MIVKPFMLHLSSSCVDIKPKRCYTILVNTMKGMAIYSFIADQKMFKFLKKVFGKKEVENEISYEPINEKLIKVTKNGRIGILEANPSNYFYVTQNGKMQLLTQDGFPLIPLDFDSISFEGETRTISQSGEIKIFYTKIVVREGDNVKEYSFEEFEKVIGNF